jgi:hypothetical protein
MALLGGFDTICNDLKKIANLIDLRYAVMNPKGIVNLEIH